MRSHSFYRPLSILCGIFLVLSLFLQPSLSFAEGTETTKKCISHSFPVSLEKGKPAIYQVTGNLCSQGDPTGKTIHVLVPGFTLTSTYWDFPYQPETYSYVDAINKSGYATLSLDRLATGKSSKPPAEDITVDRHAYRLAKWRYPCRKVLCHKAQFDQIKETGMLIERKWEFVLTFNIYFF
jgi:hypothetical protein